MLLIFCFFKTRWWSWKRVIFIIRWKNFWRMPFLSKIECDATKRWRSSFNNNKNDLIKENFTIFCRYFFCMIVCRIIILPFFQNIKFLNLKIMAIFEILNLYGGNSNTLHLSYKHVILILMIHMIRTFDNIATNLPISYCINFNKLFLD